MNNKRYNKASSRIAKRNNARKTFSLFLKIGFPMVILVGLVFILRADFLQVKDFQIVGNDTLSAENLKNFARSRTSGNKFLFIPKTNILFLNKEKLATALLSEFSRLENVEIGKRLFNKNVELKVAERKDDFLWCSFLDECFLMDKNGLIFEKTEIVDNRLIFKNVLEGDPLMQNFATPSKIQNYLKLIEILKENGFETISIIIESSDKAVADTNIGKIFFNPEELDLSLIAQNAVLLIKEIKNKNSNVKFQYIDARFGNKIFYKLY